MLRTTIILRLIPPTIAPHVLRLAVVVVMMPVAVVVPVVVAAAAEHLVEEAELSGCGPEEGEEEEEERGWEARHGCVLVECRFIRGFGGWGRSRNGGSVYVWQVGYSLVARRSLRAQEQER